MAQPIVYRVPRRFITAPEEPPPYGLLALSFTGHVLLAFAAITLSAYLGTSIDHSKIYVVNLVPAPPSLGSPAPRAVEPRPAPRVEERAPPRPARTETLPAPKVTPPRAEKPPEPVAPPRVPEVARATPLRPAELALPRRLEKETPALDTPAARERLIERVLPPPPPLTPPPRTPEPPRVAPPQALPQTPPAPAVASARSGTEPMRLGRPNAAQTTTGSISLDVSDFPFTYYIRQIHAKIGEKWKSPPVPDIQKPRAVVLFEIGRDGQIKEPKLERESGNQLYDQAALRAVLEASPFPPLPPEFKGSSLRVHIGFDLDLRSDQG